MQLTLGSTLVQPVCIRSPDDLAIQQSLRWGNIIQKKQRIATVNGTRKAVENEKQIENIASSQVVNRSKSMESLISTSKFMSASMKE